MEGVKYLDKQQQCMDLATNCYQNIMKVLSQMKYTFLFISILTSISLYSNKIDDFDGVAYFNDNDSSYRQAEINEWCSYHFKKLNSSAQLTFIRLLDCKIDSLELLLRGLEKLKPNDNDKTLDQALNKLKALEAAQTVAEVNASTKNFLSELSKDAHFADIVSALKAQESFNMLSYDPIERIEQNLQYTKNCKACARRIFENKRL